jgi:hypothetical protein
VKVLTRAVEPLMIMMMMGTGQTTSVIKLLFRRGHYIKSKENVSYTNQIQYNPDYPSPN